MSNAHELLATLGIQARQIMSEALQFQHGEVVSYDPDNNTVEVELQPSGLTTGDIQLITPWVGGPGAGMQAGPVGGTQVLVITLDADGEHMVALPATYNEFNTPPGAPSGDFWLIHASTGTYVKLSSKDNTSTEKDTLQLGGHEKLEAVAGEEMDFAAPLIQLSDTLEALGDDDAIVRKKDLQAVVDAINEFIGVVKSHKHVGNMGAPTPIDPTDAGLMKDVPAATASTVAKAKGE